MAPFKAAQAPDSLNVHHALGEAYPNDPDEFSKIFQTAFDSAPPHPKEKNYGGPHRVLVLVGRPNSSSVAGAKPMPTLGGVPTSLYQPIRLRNFATYQTAELSPNYNHLDWQA